MIIGINNFLQSGSLKCMLSVYSLAHQFESGSNLESQKLFFYFSFYCLFSLFFFSHSSFLSLSLLADRGRENRINLVWLKPSFPLLPHVAHTDIACPVQRAGDTHREREKETGEGRRAGK